MDKKEMQALYRAVEQTGSVECQEIAEKFIDEITRLQAAVNKQDTLTRVQAEQVAWVKHNFGDRPGWMPALGLAEEVGELSHAYLKREQNIRTNENHTDEIRDALADIIIFACDMATYEKIDLRLALEETWDKVKKRDWNAKREAAEAAHNPPAAPTKPENGSGTQAGGKYDSKAAKLLRERNKQAEARTEALIKKRKK